MPFSAGFQFFYFAPLHNIRYGILQAQGIVPLLITATGHGCRQMCSMDHFGFPRTRPKQAKQVRGFQTGDIVRAVVPRGVKRGTYIGKVAVRATGSFNITTSKETVQGISSRFCTHLHHCDGYRYESEADRTACGQPFFPPLAKAGGLPERDVL